MNRNELQLDPKSCLNRAAPDEPLFVLRGWDPAAPSTIRDWCAKRIAIGKNEATDPQIVEAMALADSMEEYRRNEIAGQG